MKTKLAAGYGWLVPVTRPFGERNKRMALEAKDSPSPGLGLRYRSPRNHADLFSNLMTVDLNFTPCEISTSKRHRSTARFYDGHQATRQVTQE